MLVSVQLPSTAKVLLHPPRTTTGTIEATMAGASSAGVAVKQTIFVDNYFGKDETANKDTGTSTRGTRDWEKNYEKLKAFKQTYGHTRVPQEGDWKSLHKWSTAVKFARADHTMVPLNSLWNKSRSRTDLS